MSFARASEHVLRKRDHIHVALHEDVEFHTLSAGFERVTLPYEALPEIDRDDVDTSTSLFGRRLAMPLLISAMTGGTDEGRYYNRLFAEAAQRFGLAMGVGSQRVAIENPELADTFQVRDIAPDILLFANLGAVQLNNGCGIEACRRAVEMVRADALMLHINPLQESVQPGGNTNFRDLAARIARVCEALDVPVVVKEVGHGISARTAERLVGAGVAGIDVAGAGGTSWAKVEMLRARKPDQAPCKSFRATRGICFPDARKSRFLTAFGMTTSEDELGEWGIPTVDSLLAARKAAPDLVVIASGGVRTGEDIAKSIALGADLVGMALPLLKSAAESRDALHDHIAQLQEELVTVMFCRGARTVQELRSLSDLNHPHGCS